MKELFEKQLNRAQPLTEEILEKLQLKTYFNGEEKQIGDVVLFTMLMNGNNEQNNNYTELKLNLITLNERHFDMFEYDERYIGGPLPTVKLKTK